MPAEHAGARYASTTGDGLRAVAGDRLPPLRFAHPESVVQEGTVWLRDRLRASGQDRYVAGLSGGIDSAVAALWAARAVSAARLTLLSLPCRLPGRPPGNAPPAAVRDARRVVERIPGVDFQVQEIGPTLEAEARASGIHDAAVRVGSGEASERERAWIGNLQARIRAVRLRTHANLHRGLLLGTGNLTEILLGYFTTGGDEQSDVDLLAALLKTHVRQIAPLLRVPAPVVEKAPTAGLWPGQTDADELGFGYDEADRVLHRLLDASTRRVGAPPESGLLDLVESEEMAGLDPALVRNVLERVEATRFKRRVTPRFAPRLLESLEETGSGTDDIARGDREAG